jgi:hypothetical protein
MSCERLLRPVKRVSLSATYPPESAHPIHRGIEASDAVSRAELLLWGPTEAVTTLVRYDAAPDAVRELLDRVDSLTAASLLPEDGGTYVFSRQTDFELPESVLDLVGRSKVAFPPPVVFLAGGEVRFEAVGDPEDLSEFHERLSEPLDVRIERVGGFRRGPDPATLTDRQRAALETAAAVGYYDVPRTGTVADVAARLTCATSTAGELLRKAESRVLLDYVDAGPGESR